MTSEQNYEVSPSREWLLRMADAEDRHASITAAGLAADLGMLKPESAGGSRVFGRLIQIARRARELTLEALAESADVDVSQLLAIEREGATPAPRTVYQLAHALHLSTGRLMEVAGLAKPRDPELTQAALRFAARSEPVAKLSNEEREAFEEFVKVLVETSDKE